MASYKAPLLGQLLLTRGAVTQAQLDTALRQGHPPAQRLGEVLVGLGFIDETVVARALADQLGVTFLEPPLTPAAEAIELLDVRLARKRRVLPIAVSGRSLQLAMADPLDLGAIGEVGFQTGCRIVPLVSTPSGIEAAVEATYGDEWRRLVRALPAVLRAADRNSLERAAKAAPVVRLVDHLLDAAIRAGSSDVHVECVPTGVVIRYRVDGVLRTVAQLPATAQAPVVSRIKILSGMDIAVKRRPQDGGLSWRFEGRDLRLRVSTLPMNVAEKVVLRILDPAQAPSGLAALGLDRLALARVRSMLCANGGVLLAAGPTGSGKSSTLYGALRELDREQRNVITLEDPIEYRMPGLNQVQVDSRAGLGFAAALRAVLRQDPDVIMIGEIRDRETAEIAMTAAVTGHLVLSTIHTVDAPGAITRLLDMGVPPFLVAGGLTGVIAQRLVRTVCGECRGRTGRGCAACDRGYSGRTGVFQVLVMSDGLREEVVHSTSTATLRRIAADEGMGSLSADARRKVAEGTTTPHEVARVLQTDPASALSCRICSTRAPAGAEGCPSCGHPRHRRCTCGRQLQATWRFCPWCLRRA